MNVKARAKRVVECLRVVFFTASFMFVNSVVNICKSSYGEFNATKNSNILWLAKKLFIFINIRYAECKYRNVNTRSYVFSLRNFVCISSSFEILFMKKNQEEKLYQEITFCYILAISQKISHYITMKPI